MFGKEKPGSNFEPLYRSGHALWEVWFDAGDGTHASPVMWDGVRRLFLDDGSAAVAAKRAAAQTPDKRFQIKAASPDATLVNESSS